MNGYESIEFDEGGADDDASNGCREAVEKGKEVDDEDEEEAFVGDCTSDG